jgi:hypothetical protein
MKASTLFSTKKIILVRRSTCKLLCLGIFLIAILWLAKSVYKERDGTYIRLEGLQNIRISSTEYPYFSFLVDKPHTVIVKEKSLFYQTATRISEMPPYEFYTFTFVYVDQQQIHFHYSPDVNEVYSIKYQLVEPSSDLKEALLDLIASYRQEIHKTYGALLVWEEADKAFPMFATAKITDIYTGASFNVQRREGSKHVDAQPLTAEDTAIMKKIYGGRWSWDRLGIIVDVGGYRMAASMHGMPHGGGKITDNNFPGHFCIHFLGSTIHGGGMDTRHHVEILKAAGKLPLDDF